MKIQVRAEKMMLAGNWVDKEKTFDVYDPQDNRLVAQVPLSTKEDMEQAIHEAEQAFKKHQEWPTHERIKVLKGAVEYIQENKELYAQTIATEGSKTITEARGEVKRAMQTLEISAEEARRLKGETINFDQNEGSENRIGYYYRFPVGVVGAITPFNDPLNLVAHKVGPAIASGNAIVVKPATVTPLSALLLADAFEAAGLPKGMLSIITGSGRELGETLVTHPAIKMVSFTGGINVGKTIAQQAGVKQIGMELGSNSPVIVLNDCDLEDAVSSCVSGAFGAVGQNCIGVQRIYIENDLYEEFTKRLVSQTNALNVGDKLSENTDVGPLIKEDEAKRVESWVNDAIQEGGRLLTGGIRDGAFYSPTVLAEVPEHAQIVKEEVFGPVVTVYPVDSLEEAVEKSNDVDYGLQAGVFTKNLDHAFYAVQHLDCGGVMVNDSSDYRIDEMPFGGVKHSGLGREGVRYSIEAMTEPKVVAIKL
ncbi:aldehyde dehydrogenase family protein [Tenuibacillus multivorans]|uniref:3-sulfolactaldehyde dehydrogenase n=1 Tax=Tenuibacillus multivorans TaxID=237069 RepID=A0A1G9YFE9_9BACI|nr:aldehyde dehydrogenase family protein [Tenuibacillus multivorans]GEL78537.1 aldehyde dehydrogenase [Tenuibacillus multivorans]SDN07787.1 glyceraldehyde-3-phosphate dehydrogenase (NADP+) [Tenuibacillus multivorans]